MFYVLPSDQHKDNKSGKQHVPEGLDVTYLMNALSFSIRVPSFCTSVIVERSEAS